VAVIVGTLVLTAFERCRHKRMAADRTALTEAEFISQMAAKGVRADTAKFVWNEAVYYYIEPLKPDPKDRWQGTMRIDSEDLEDVTAKFWKQQAWVEPPREAPVIVPEDPTLFEYAAWLDGQRQLQE
jgi:hypothetical protein